jgi:hypothetical protein
MGSLGLVSRGTNSSIHLFLIKQSAKASFSNRLDNNLKMGTMMLAKGDER